MNQPNRTYTITLIVLAFFLVITVATLTFLRQSSKLDDSTRWVFQLSAFIYALYAVAIVVTLILRWRAPNAGRLATMALNIVLLPMFPIGTVVGIYGLSKVDKQPTTPAPKVG